LGWRKFILQERVTESATITSFYLRPTDAKPLPSFRPGQFLTIQIDIPGQEWPVIRTYTISDRPSRQYYRLSVKRERIAGQPIGLVSNYLHDSFQIGDILFAKAPTGDFCLDLRGKRPVMLISAGVGITPMICMLSALEGSDIRRPICFIHGSRNGQEHAFASQVRELAAEFENIRVHVAYSRPLPADQPGKDYHSQGRISIETVKALMPGRQAEFYLCGPNAFMRGNL